MNTKVASIKMTVSVCALALFCLSCASQRDSVKSGLIHYSRAEVKDRQQYLLGHVSTTNIHPSLRPVHLKIGNRLCASGTMVLDTDQSPSQIVTANHIFSETISGSDFYDYAVITPSGYSQKGHLSKVVVDSIRSSSSNEGISDIAIGFPGKPQRISRTSKVRIAATIPMKMMYKIRRIEPLQITSLITGQRFSIIGELENTAGMKLHVVAHKNVAGESGSGFWGDDQKLYVLAGSVPVTPFLNEVMGPLEHKALSVMSAMTLPYN